MSSKLQDEIKQTKPFARKTAEALLAVLRTATVLEHAQNEALRPHGITSTQYNVLRILQGAGDDGMCGREVAERLISRVPDVSRLLDRMEEMELVTRERDPEDRRHVTARISAKGRGIVVEATPSLEVIERASFRDMEPGLVVSLVKALDTIREAV
jgi:DNA-binding MarR family transcriptional regulator